MILLRDPAGVSLCDYKQQIKKPDEADHQADEEQLSEGRYQKARKNLGRQAEMPWGWEEAREADPANKQNKTSNSNVTQDMRKIKWHQTHLPMVQMFL